MRLGYILCIAICAVTACTGGQHEAQTNDRILAISFPGGPNPPTENLVHGTKDFDQIDPQASEESMLTEALLRCGLRHLSWTDYGSDGASRLIIPDNEMARAAIKCAAKAFPLDFYVAPGRASKSDLAALTQTPR